MAEANPVDRVLRFAPVSPSERSETIPGAAPVAERTFASIADRDLLQALTEAQTANAELERIERVQTRLLSTVSHELRTPLTAIQGYADLIVNFPLPMEEVRDYAAEISRGVARLVRLTDDLLELDRTQRARLQPQPVQLQVDALLKEVVSVLRPTAQEHPIRLECGPGAPVVTGDADRLTQVFVNLIANAIKYSDPGRPIDVRRAVVEEKVLVTVRDRGCGIPAGDLERIFEPYTRLPNPHCAAGSGLGLAIARDLVEQHGGTLRAAHADGGGSIFTVSLPLAEALV